MIHTLKTWPTYYAAICDGRKRFELRRDDRDFQVGDCLVLQEWEPDRQVYTGEMRSMRVTYRTTVFMCDGFVALGIEPWAPVRPDPLANVMAAMRRAFNDPTPANFQAVAAIRPGRSPQNSGDPALQRVAAMLLTALVKECRAHNGDYHWRTDESLLDQAENVAADLRVVRPDPAAPPHWLLEKLRYALDEARRTISVGHPVRDHVEAALADITYYETMTTKTDTDGADPAAPLRNPNEDDFCSCGHKRESHHIWGRCHGLRCKCTKFVLFADEAASLVDRSNHHNALTCPHCNPKGLQFADPAAPLEEKP
jgi:hypothetical protein